MSMRREASVAAAIVALGLVLAFAAPGFFARDNLSDLGRQSGDDLVAERYEKFRRIGVFEEGSVPARGA